MTEEWKLFEGYRVYNTGRVFWNDNGTWREKRVRMKNGQLNVNLSINGKQKYFILNHIVAGLFVPNPEPSRFKHVINVDGNRENSNASNLMWVEHANILSEEEALKRIKDKHGDRFVPIGQYDKANEPMLFRCSACGCEFNETAQHMFVYDEPCKQCKDKAIKERKRQREEQRQAERDARLLPDSEAHVVYVYTFEDGCKYVGLTCTPGCRDAQHRCSKYSAVYKHSKDTGLPIPKPEYLAVNLNARDAQRLEAEQIEILPSDLKLNRAKGGSLGNLYISHTIEEAKEIAKHYATRKELKNACQWAYDLLSWNGLLMPKCKPNGGLLQRFQRRTSAELTIKWQ